MPSPPTTLKGIIHGKIIELLESPGLPDGQAVNVTVAPASMAPAPEDPRDALRRAAGSWTDDVEGLDRFLEWNRQQRKVPRPEIPE